MAQQLLFDLPVRTARGRDDFLVTPCNEDAVKVLDQWPEWPGVAACLIGAQRSGKTHLVEVWREMSGAQVIEGSDLTEETIASLLSEKSVAVDNAAAVRHEAALFHLFNALKNNGGHLLLTGETAPSRWSLTLPDLKSRLATAVIGELQPPDDALLKGLVSKLFQDYQVEVKEGVIAFVISRIERSFHEVTDVVEALNTEAMRRSSAVTIPLARDILERR
jgi:chromosomal replication initiation ATPase DnaA